MNIRIKLVGALVLCFLHIFFSVNADGSIIFGDKSSSLKIVGDASVMKIVPSSLTIDNGSVFECDGGTVQGNLVFLNSDCLDLTEGTVGGGIIYLRGNDSFFGDPRGFNTGVIASNRSNRLSGFTRLTGQIYLQDFRTTLTIALINTMNQEIRLNNGTVILENDFGLADDSQFTGSGTVDLNGFRLTFGGTPLSWPDQILWTKANDLVLNNKMTVTGIWYFSGNSRITGNGNLVDLTSGGSIWIKSGATLSLADIKVKGLGSGRIVFEDDTAQLRLSQAEVEMDGNITWTIGGVYVEGPTTIVTQNKTLTLSSLASMTVDNLALEYDTLDFGNENSIQPIKTADPNQKFIAYLNNGTIRKVVTQKVLTTFSNALIYLTNNNSNAILNLSNRIKDNSNTLLYLNKNNSNALLFCCKNNSNTLLFLNKNNSNTLLYLNNNNSNAILDLRNRIKDNSNTLLYLNKNNSNALLFCCKNNSNTLLFLNKNNSNTLLYLTNNNSNAILDLRNRIKDNSNTLLYLNKNNSNALLFCCKNNSNTLLFLNKNNSNTLLYLNNNNSNAILDLRNRIKDNSNTLLYLNKNNSNALLFCCNNNSNAILELGNRIKDNSNTLLYLNKNNSNALLFCCNNNSNAILELGNRIKDNSNTLLYLNKNNSNALLFCCKNLSNALLWLTTNTNGPLYQAINAVSNTVLYLDKNNSNALLFCCNNNSNAILNLENKITANSNTLLYLNKNNSNALLFCCNNNSNAILNLEKRITANSNTLLYLNKNNSNALLFCCNNNSNAILNLEKRITANSNTLLYLNKNNSNALLFCCNNNSNAILNLEKRITANSNTLLYLNKNNSNALLFCCKNNSNTLLFLDKNNSNAIVWLDAQLDTIDHGPWGVFIDIAPTYTLSFDIFLSASHTLLVTVDTTINGSGHAIKFARKIKNQFRIQPGVKVVLENVVLRDFDDEAVSLMDPSSQLIFGSCTKVELSDCQDLTKTWTFVGETVLYGDGNVLNLSDKNIVLLQPGHLIIQETALQNIGNTNIACAGPKARLEYKSCSLHLAQDYTFSVGSIRFVEENIVTGAKAFIYTSTGYSIVNTYGTLVFDKGLTFSYAPASSNRDLIALQSRDSKIFFDGCTVVSSLVGMRLTRGTLCIDHNNFLHNTGAANVSQGFAFGNGTSSDDLDIQVFPGGSLELIDGLLDYANVDA